MTTPIASVDSRFLRRTALFDQDHKLSSGRKVVRRLPYNIVEYQGFGELIEPVDITLGKLHVQTDKHVTDISFVNESAFYRPGPGLSRGGPTGPLR
jgi:hypothetical protein